MQVENLIIGQGICGTFLSYYLQKENQSFHVIDNDDSTSPSRIAAGIINPVTGRRMVKVWMAETLLPFAAKAYSDIGHDLAITAISQKNLVDFFPNPHQREVFLERIRENDPYLHSYPEQNQFNPYFKYELGCGEIRQCYTAHLETLLPAWRQQLIANNQLNEEKLDITELNFSDTEVRYREIRAKRIIFCDGLNSFQNPFFKELPFAPNKGESLIVEITSLPDTHIYKKGFMLSPLAIPGLFWLGSNYQWKFTNGDPSKEFYEQAERHLKVWLKLPFKILDHKAALRPATIERRPFVGVHPHRKNIAILNGMGTKGCSLAPYFARELVDHLVHEKPLTPEADIRRFSKILARET